MIDKITFCTVIENLRQQLYLDRRYGECIQEMFGADKRCTYNDSLLVKSIMSLLHIHFPKDEDDFCEIEHYCFVIEFGKADNQEVLSAEDFYDHLTK